ncbi:MAG: adenine deaminase [Chitinophagales bacterium]
MVTLNQITGNLVDVLNNHIYPAKLTIEKGIITCIEETEEKYDQYLVPGFIDAHVHIESSMLTPTEFARLAVTHGTVASVSDPHEIGNVLGVAGVEYMLENAQKTPFKFYFGAPSCVPATTFETAGAVIDVADVDYLLQKKEIKYLSEMMNFPGVLFEDEEVMAKIALAKKYGKPIDGHAPGLRGENAKKYIAAGISTDHECFTYEEALEKLQYGMKIIIREGSAAKNFEALIPLLDEYYENMMFCSDDKHPNDLLVGHIDELVKRALKKGIDVMKILQVACINPVLHYGMEVGLLQENQPADFIVVNNLSDFKILQTYIEGELVAEQGKTLLDYIPANTPNNFHAKTKHLSTFTVKDILNKDEIKVIEALEGQLITNVLHTKKLIKNSLLSSNVEEDVLKLVVVNRYEDVPPAIAFIKNFGFKQGAIASSVAHDSHNIIAVGVSDDDICNAVNLLIETKGGLSLAQGETQEVLPLPIAGIMTPDNAYKVAQQYIKLDKLTKKMGTTLYAPYMTLSFMALLVIPSLKLSDKGLFDGDKFSFTDLYF